MTDEKGRPVAGGPEILIPDLTKYLTAFYRGEPIGAIWVGGQRTGFRGVTFTDAEQAARYALAEDAAGQLNDGVYQRLTTMRPAVSGRGKDVDSVAAYAFAVDIDFDGPGHKAKSGVAGIDDAHKLVEAAGLPEPTTWVMSGGGCYPQWWYEEPIDLADPETQARVKQHYGNLIDHLRSVARDKFGWNSPDPAFKDLARVARMPFTTWRKVAGDERQATWDGDSGTRFALTALVRDALSDDVCKTYVIAEEPSTVQNLDGARSLLFGEVGSTRIVNANDRSYTQAQVAERLSKPLAELVRVYAAGTGGGDIRDAIMAVAREAAHYYPVETTQKVIGDVWREHGSKRADGGWEALDAGDLNVITSAYDYQERHRAAGNLEQGWKATITAEPEQAEPDGWDPVDLTDVLSGQWKPVLPTLGYRSDGQSMLYARKEHCLASEPECGKTWWVLMQVRAVLQSGGRVVYVDFEDDEGTIGGRLHRDLGVSADLMGPDHFRYVRPERMTSLERYKALLSFGEDRYATLVVLDGVTEGYGQLGLKINDQEAAVEWRKMFIRPAMNLGAATLATDHEVKRKEDRGRGPIGANHKFAGLNGVMFKLELVSSFGEGMRGKSRVLVTKDRNGGLRKHGQPTREPGVSYMGDLVGDGERGPATWSFYAPKAADSTTADDSDLPKPALRPVVNAVRAFLADNPDQGTNAINAELNYRKTNIGEALAWLELHGDVISAPGPNRSKLWKLSDQWYASTVEHSVSGGSALFSSE